MGAAESSIEVPGGGTEGYQVIRVQQNSPGHQAGLEAFFDYIIAVNGVRLNADDDIFKNSCISSIDKPMKILVFSSRDMSVRELVIIPSKSWGGEGVLGVSIRFQSFDGAADHVWHVLNVQANSPAAAAGLRSDSDYIVGVNGPPGDLADIIQSSNMKPLRLHVYNSEDDATREVSVTPNDGWGGDGSLGCELATGYLHRIPTKTRTMDSIAVEQFSTKTSDGFTDVPLHDHGHSHSGGAQCTDSHGHNDHNDSHHGHSHSDHGHSHSGHAHTHEATDVAVPFHSYPSTIATAAGQPLPPPSYSAIATTTAAPITATIPSALVTAPPTATTAAVVASTTAIPLNTTAAPYYPSVPTNIAPAFPISMPIPPLTVPVTTSAPVVVPTTLPSPIATMPAQFPASIAALNLGDSTSFNNIVPPAPIQIAEYSFLPPSSAAATPRATTTSSTSTTATPAALPLVLGDLPNSFN